MQRKLYMLLSMVVMFGMMVSYTYAATCSSPGMPSYCVEVWPNQQGNGYEYYAAHNVYFFRYLSNSNHYFLLMGNISCESTCAVFGFNDATPDNNYTTTFDLNGYTIKYSDADYESIPNNGFEEWSGNTPLHWSVISGTVEPRNTSYWQPMSGDYVLYTDGPVVLESSQIYLPAARAYNAYVTVGRAASSDITLEVLDSSGNTACSETKQGYFRGQTIACRLDINTPGYYKLRITTQGYAYFDMTGIVPLGDYGVATFTPWSLSSSNQNQEPIVQNLAGLDIPTTGDTAHPVIFNYLEVKNGAIIAGHENQMSYGFRTRGIVLAILHNLTIIGNGLKSHTIRTAGEIYNNTLIANMPWYFARENSYEENVILGGGRFYNNRAIGGQGVIRLGGTGTEIFNNYLRNNAQATNHYAIIHSGAVNPVIHDNIFDPIEGSGILTYVGHGYRIYNNHFNVRTAPCNVEYINEDYSTNGIRLNDYGSGDNHDNWIYNNTFNISATRFDTAWSNCMPVTTGIFYSAYGENNRIFNNTFTIIKDNNDDNAPAFAIYIGGASNQPENNTLFFNNHFITNDKAVWITSYYGETSNMWFENNTFERIPNTFYVPDKPDAAIRIGYWLRDANNIHMVNNHFTGGFYDDSYYFTGNSADGHYDITKQWYLHVKVFSNGNPVDGATVRATSISQDDSVEARTDANGYALLTLTEYTESGDTRESGTHNRVYHTPYSLYIEHNGLVKTIDSIDMDSEKSITIELGGPCESGSQRSCGIDTGACQKGTQSCINGVWGPCEGSIGPSEEICDGLDNDCDGETDENLGTITCGLGVCRHTINVCENGHVQTCNPFEGQLFEDEVTNCSNGIDENCDGVDSKCAVNFSMSAENSSDGVILRCTATAPSGIQLISILENSSGYMKEASSVNTVSDRYYFIEAEDFDYLPEDWDVCPDNASHVQGNSCEDDRSRSANMASNLAHAVADDNIASGGVTDMTYNLTIPAGEYAVWARSFQRSNPSNRIWRVSVDSFESSDFGNLDTGEWDWQRSNINLQISSSGNRTIRIVDAYPDAYWNYPDVILLTTNLTFNPSRDCGDDIGSIGYFYSLGTCGLAPLKLTASGTLQYTTGTYWKCRVTDGRGKTFESEPKPLIFSTNQADLDGDGRISFKEILAYINKWKQNLVSLRDLIKAVKIWENEY